MHDTVARLHEARIDHPHVVAPVGPDRELRGKHRDRLLNIGIIASEFPPDHGGMQEHARGVVACLAIDHRVSMFTSCGPRLDMFDRNVIMKPAMRWQTSRDVAELERDRMDAWITLNAGLAPYSLELSAPVFAYVHGNDFTRSWLPRANRPIRLARALCGEDVVGRWRTRQISAGLRAARWMFANSAFPRDLCARLYGLPEDRVSVVPPGMGSASLHTSDRGPGAGHGDRLRLVMVSRLALSAERENITGVLENLALLKGEMALSYTVIGDGDDLPRLRALAVSLGVAADVHFLGAVDTSTIIEAFGRSDAFIMAVTPGDSDVEGFGMVYAEAAACGLPSIGTRAGGIPEVIEHGTTGMLLDNVLAEGMKGSRAGCAASSVSGRISTVMRSVRRPDGSRPTPARR